MNWRHRVREGIWGGVEDSKQHWRLTVESVNLGSECWHLKTNTPLPSLLLQKLHLAHIHAHGSPGCIKKLELATHKHDPYLWTKHTSVFAQTTCLTSRISCDSECVCALEEADTNVPFATGVTDWLQPTALSQLPVVPPPLNLLLNVNTGLIFSSSLC